MGIALIIGLAVLVLPVVLASMFLCAPKWWEEKAPDSLYGIRDRFDSRANEIALTVFRLPVFKPVALVGKVFASVLLGSIILPVALVVLYVQACVAVIEGACPYTAGSEWREFVAGTWSFMTKPFEPGTW